MLLDSVGQNFTENFCLYIHQRYWPIVFCQYLCLVVIRVIVNEQNDFRSVSFILIFWKSLRMVCINSSLQIWYQSFAQKAICSWTFVCRRCLHYIFHFISTDWSIQLIYFFLIQLWQAVCLQKVEFIFLRLSNLLVYNCSWYSLSLSLFYFCSISLDFSFFIY